MTYRFVICLDVNEDTLEEAYEQVYKTMGTVDTEPFQWESTDEVFDPDGAHVDPEDVQKARMKVFKKLNPDF